MNFYEIIAFLEWKYSYIYLIVHLICAFFVKFFIKTIDEQIFYVIIILLLKKEGRTQLSETIINKFVVGEK